MTLAEIIDWVQKLGAPAAPIFALLWWLERGERIGAHEELRNIAKDSATAITKAESALSHLISVFQPRSR